MSENEEPFAGLEAQLGQLRPEALPAKLRDRISESLRTGRLTWTDRATAIFMGLSAAAVLFIVLSVTGQVLQSGIAHSAPPPQMARVEVDRGYRLLLAAK